jgi:hypothetical protein
LTADVEAVFGISNADALEVEVFNGAINGGRVNSDIFDCGRKIVGQRNMN